MSNNFQICCKQITQLLSNLYPSYKFIRMGNLSTCENSSFLSHAAYGFYQPFTLSSKPHAIIQKRMQKDRNALASILARLVCKKQLDHPNIVKLADYSWAEEPYCYRVMLSYEFIPVSFGERARQVGEFKEEELFRLISEVESALWYLKNNSLTHSNISADTILFGENGYMITDNRYLTNSTTYQKALKGSTHQILSENLIDRLKQKSKQPPLTISDDLFSLGLTILSVVTCTPVQSFYDWLKYELRGKVIENKLKQMSKLYSSKLIKRLKELLSEGMDVMPTTTNSLCESLDIFNEEYTHMTSKLRSMRVIDF